MCRLEIGNARIEGVTKAEHLLWGEKSVWDE